MKIIDDPRCWTVDINLSMLTRNVFQIAGVRALVDDILIYSRIIGAWECRINIVIKPPASTLEDPPCKVLISNSSTSNYDGLSRSVSISGGF